MHMKVGGKEVTYKRPAIKVTSHWHYRKPEAPEQGLQILRKSHFHPEILTPIKCEGGRDVFRNIPGILS